jgi:hypothetical protein
MRLAEAAKVTSKIIFLTSFSRTSQDFLVWPDAL